MSLASPRKVMIIQDLLLNNRAIMKDLLGEICRKGLWLKDGQTVETRFGDEWVTGTVVRLGSDCVEIKLDCSGDTIACRNLGNVLPLQPSASLARRYLSRKSEGS